MKTIIPMLDPSTIADETELTALQLASLDLFRLPRKVRIRVMRPNGIVQIQHIGKRLRLRLLFDFDFSGAPDYEDHSDLAECVLGRASWLLDRDRLNHRTYESTGNGEVEIAVDEKLTGIEVLAALDQAVEALVSQANALISVLAKGILIISPKETDWR